MKAAPTDVVNVVHSDGVRSRESYIRLRINVHFALQTSNLFNNRLRPPSTPRHHNNHERPSKSLDPANDSGEVSNTILIELPPLTSRSVQKKARQKLEGLGYKQSTESREWGLAVGESMCHLLNEDEDTIVWVYIVGAGRVEKRYSEYEIQYAVQRMDWNIQNDCPTYKQKAKVYTISEEELFTPPSFRAGTVVQIGTDIVDGQPASVNITITGVTCDFAPGPSSSYESPWRYNILGGNDHGVSEAGIELYLEEVIKW